MKLNEIVELFFKGLDDVMMSLGIEGNKYELQETKILDLEGIKSVLDEENIIIWGKVEKKQGILLLCLRSIDVKNLIGSVEGTVPEEINESVMNTLRELGNALLGGGLSSLSQFAKKSVVQFESTGILRGEELLNSSFYSGIEEPLVCSFVEVKGNINYSYPWMVLFDDLLKRWFPIDEGKPDEVKDSMLTREEIESFNEDDVTIETAKQEEKNAGEKPVSTKSKDSVYRNLDVILDIQVEATAKLGSIEMPLASVLSLGPGSVINVGHEVDSPIELYVNNKLIAKGDVVIVDEKFGIRITEIVSPQERIESLQ